MPTDPLNFSAPWFRTPLSWETSIENESGSSIYVTTSVGIVCDKGENGHAYLEMSDDDETWVLMDFVGHHNLLVDSGLSGTTGVGGNLKGFIPPDWYWRYVRDTFAGSPQYAFLNGIELGFTLGS